MAKAVLVVKKGEAQDSLKGTPCLAFSGAKLADWLDAKQDRPAQQLQVTQKECLSTPQS